MEKELCLKFLVHLYKYSQGVLVKQHIDEIDVLYINNEVENFHRRLDSEKTIAYDKLGALGQIVKLEQETATDKAINVSMFLLIAKFKLLKLFFGTKDQAHQKRFNKISEFSEKVKKVIALIEYA